MKKMGVVGLVVITFFLAGCAQNTGMSRGSAGGLGGAASGALLGQIIGGDTEATLLGAAIGGVLGYVIGNEMDKADQRRLTQTYETAPSGTPVAWVNPDSGNQYKVTPQPAYSTPSQPTCRDAQVEAIIDGQREVVNTTACRNSSGQWVLQK